LQAVSLTKYLDNIGAYLSDGTSLAPKRSLLKERSMNERIIVAAQSCLLPVEKGKETKFNVALYNY
jgi:hypothetical protein